MYERCWGRTWTERGRPPAGHYTRKTSEAELRRLLTDAERGTLAGASRTSGADLRGCVRRVAALRRAREAAGAIHSARLPQHGQLLPPAGHPGGHPLEEITTEVVNALRGLCRASHRGAARAAVDGRGLRQKDAVRALEHGCPSFRGPPCPARRRFGAPYGSVHDDPPCCCPLWAA